MFVRDRGSGFDPDTVPGDRQGIATSIRGRMDRVGGKVTIRTRQRGAHAILEVADTGIGIPAGELPRIFDRFWRGQAAAQTSGSGIGLAIAAELAVAHGGTLTADSQPGHGATFTLTLPLA